MRKNNRAENIKIDAICLVMNNKLPLTYKNIEIKKRNLTAKEGWAAETPTINSRLDEKGGKGSVLITMVDCKYIFGLTHCGFLFFLPVFASRSLWGNLWCVCQWTFSLCVHLGLCLSTTTITANQILLVHQTQLSGETC